jgi:hypothetical protein
MPILFSGQVQPAYICLPSIIGCQTWTRTKTNGLTNRRATLTPPGNGAAGRILTCIVPIRRRMPHVFDHGSNSKLVSAAGLAPAIPRSQAECVGYYATRWFAPMDFRDRGREKRYAETLGIGLAVRFEIGASGGTCTHTLPADNGLLFYSATEAEMVGSAGNAPARHFRLFFVTPDLQSGSRITSLGGPAQAVVAGVGVTPT